MATQLRLLAICFPVFTPKGNAVKDFFYHIRGFT